MAATFSNRCPGEMVEAVLPLLSEAPSLTTVFLFTILCGPNVPAPQKAMALSMHSKVYGGPWTMWWEKKDDAANKAWHRKLVEGLSPYNLGYYLGESNTVERPANAVQAFTPEKWQKLYDLRDKYDPNRVFFDYFDGLGDVQ